MDIVELLHELRTNVLRDVADLDVDAETPEGQAALNEVYLWTDETLISYINDAYRTFARRTLCLKDKNTAEICEVTLISGQAEYALDARILAVYSVTDEDDQRSLQRLGHSPLTGANADIAYRATHNITQAGQPSDFTTDESVRTLRLYPEPDDSQAGKVYRLRVARLPLVPLALPAGAEDPLVPEIPEQYHMDMLEWAAWRALRNHDTDAENMNKASAHKKRFNEAIEEATAEHKLANYAPPQFKFNANYG